MFTSISRSLLCLAATVCLATGCAASTEEPVDANVPDTEENLGKAQQATIYLDNCAEGDLDPNERFDITFPGNSHTLARSSTYLNPGGSCGATARRTSIVEFDVHSVQNAYSYKFEVVPWGTFTTSQCADLKMFVRVQRRNRTTGIFESVDFRHGNPDGVGETYSPYLRGRLRIDPTTFQLSCTLPYYTFTRQNLASYYTTETDKYRIRAYIEKGDGTYASLKLSGTNMGNQ